MYELNFIFVILYIVILKQLSCCMSWTGISIPVSSAWLLTCIFFEYGIKNIEFYNILIFFFKRIMT